MAETLRCDGLVNWDEHVQCPETVTHIDDKGYVYCRTHGVARKQVRRCRQLKPAELRKLRAGEQLSSY